MLHKLQHIEPLGEHTLRISFDDGEVRVVDFASIIQRGGVFVKLDDPNFFAQAQISEDGRYITWPGELDFCADALRVREVSAVE